MPNVFPDLQSAYDWLNSQVNYEHNLGAVAYGEQNYELEGFRRRLAALGHPQRGLRTVHIAGTRGKGSAALALEALLRAAGLHTAVYTSPHIHEYRERIRLDGQPIGSEPFARLLARVAETGQPADEPTPASDPARPFKTVFEMLTALFFLAARGNADAPAGSAASGGAAWAIVETGLGGRLDATNVLDPGPVLLTRIGLEHTRLLGDTLEKIAGEKAAILKPGGWGVMASQFGDGDHPDGGPATGVFRVRAREAGARLDRASDLCPFERVDATPDGLSLTLRFEGRPLALQPPLFGEFQAENLQNAFAMLARLRAEGLVPRIPDAVLADAISRLVIPGRMQRVSRRPELFVDGGHCPTAAAALARSMRLHFGVPATPTTGLIVGMLSDKDHDGFFRELAAWPGWAWLWIYRVPSPRAAGPADLARAAGRYFHNIVVFEKMEQALQSLSRHAEKWDRVVATGSLYGIARFEDWGRKYGIGGIQTQAEAQTEPSADH